MTEDTFERAKLIKSEIIRLEIKLKWIKTIYDKAKQNKDAELEELADYAYLMTSNEISGLKISFKEL